MMAQREATQTEAKRKAAEREANKETRRKEKEERAEQVCIRKEDRAAKKVQREQVEAEHRAHRGGRRVGVGIGAGGEGTLTRRKGAAAGEVAEAGAEGACDSVMIASAYRPPPWTSASPPRDTDHVVAMVRPLSPPHMMQVHPSSVAIVSTSFMDVQILHSCSILLWPYNKCFLIQRDLHTTITQPGFHRWA